MSVKITIGKQAPQFLWQPPSYTPGEMEYHMHFVIARSSKGDDAVITTAYRGHGYPKWTCLSDGQGHMEVLAVHPFDSRPDPDLTWEVVEAITKSQTAEEWFEQFTSEWWDAV